MKQLEFEQMMFNSKEVSALDRFSVEHYTPIVVNDKRVIENIISYMINIQAILARHYLYKRALGISVSTDSTFFITEHTCKEIEMLRSIFDEVFIISRSDGTLVNVQVSRVNDLAYEVFLDMISYKQINEQVQHLTLERTFTQDFCRKAYFEIEKSTRFPVNSEYFDYLIKGTTLSSFINPLFVDVSGFRLEEIEQNDVVQQLASRVKHLYLLVFENNSDETPKSFYSKQLRWCL
ncbi:hypothetical protein MHH60_28420 [Paenibacillus sp. FSL H7-0716]|uniref:Uncharacterized protein n=1 Tax=Paenibacillus odorifer TaxID=189426 RepID=A0A1R0XYA0_9BACL|nr:hypothetical protein [Paenibacillus odorifer]OMD40071.1 hypothetical protein BSK52_14345 [Paenibacillus odorifer]OME19813.1 hypothetical protein BSK47_14675 [Paenibacillus odorifer]